MIIASNIIPFLSFLVPNFVSKILLSQITTTFYYFLIVAFNYFYTNLFWDPEKISEQLRKASVSIVNISPGRDTIVYLERVVRSTSILGGLFLCSILIFFDFDHFGLRYSNILVKLSIVCFFFFVPAF